MTSYVDLKSLLSPGIKIEMPDRPTAHALAKCAWEWRGGADQEKGIGIFDAIQALGVFICVHFKGAEDWSRRSDISLRPEFEDGYRLHLILDKTGLFSDAARLLMDYNHRGCTRNRFPKEPFVAEQNEMFDD